MMNDLPTPPGSLQKGLLMVVSVASAFSATAYCMLLTLNLEEFQSYSISGSFARMGLTLLSVALGSNS